MDDFKINDRVIATVNGIARPARVIKIESVERIRVEYDPQTKSEGGYAWIDPASGNIRKV